MFNRIPGWSPVMSYTELVREEGRNEFQAEETAGIGAL